MIRLLTVIGHGINLLPHFIRHYQRYVDEINIIIYESDIAPNIKSEVQTIISDYDNVNIVFTVKDRVFDWEKVTKTYNFVSNRNQNDWFVIADIDEFHLYPNDDLKGLISECDNNGYDIVRGGFIDRIGEDGSFPNIVDDVTLWEQFPNAGSFRLPMSGANPNKICIKKGWVTLTNGQHYAKIDDHTTWRWQGWNHPLIDPINTVQVHHFKWDETSIERIKAVADVKKDYAYSTEYELMYNALRRTKFKINLTEEKFYFELGLTQPEFRRYRNWNKLIKIIKSI